MSDGNALQRVDKYRTKHFPGCYLFIFLVLTFMCEILPAKAFEVLSNVSQAKRSIRQHLLFTLRWYNLLK